MNDFSFYINAARNCTDQDSLFISVPQVHAKTILSLLIEEGFNARRSLIDLPGWGAELIEIVYFDDHGAGNS